MTASESRKGLRAIKTGLGPLDEVLRELPVTKNSLGTVKLGERSARETLELLQEGDLLKLLQALGSKQAVVASVSLKDIADFEKLVGLTPQKSLRRLDQMVAAQRDLNPHLAVTPAEMHLLSASGKRDLELAEQNLRTKFKPGTKLKLTVGSLLIGGAGLSLLQATRARKGCWMFTVIDGKTTSCRIAELSCGAMTYISSTAATACIAPHPSGQQFNTTLMVMHVVRHASPLQKKLAKSLNLSAEQLLERLLDIIDKSFEKVTQVFAQWREAFPSLDICGLRDDRIENAVVPVCRMCSSDAPPTSTKYIDPSRYATNITFKCIANPSMLDTLCDIVYSTGANVLQFADRSLWQPVKSFARIVLILAFIGILLFLVLKYLVKKRSTTEETGSTYDSSPLLPKPALSRFVTLFSR